MRSITVLQKRATRLQEDIKSLLMDNYRYDEALTTRLNVISKISNLRAELATVQREIRERQAAWTPVDCQAFVALLFSLPRWYWSIRALSTF